MLKIKYNTRSLIIILTTFESLAHFKIHKTMNIKYDINSLDCIKIMHSRLFKIFKNSVYQSVRNLNHLTFKHNHKSFDRDFSILVPQIFSLLIIIFPADLSQLWTCICLRVTCPCACPLPRVPGPRVLCQCSSVLTIVSSTPRLVVTLLRRWMRRRMWRVSSSLSRMILMLELTT